MRSLALLALLAACSDGKHITLDGGVDTPAGCHYDCVGAVQCHAGIAFQRMPQPIACEQWVGSCPGATHACVSCDLEFSTARFPGDWSQLLDVLCAETAVAKVGDSCANQCLPTRAVADGLGNVSQQYLACDTASSQCAVAPAPDVADYLGPCTTMLSGPGIDGVAISGGPCLLSWDAPAMKTRQGSTIFCIGDWECPAGSSCDDGLTVVDIPQSHAAVCRPGARGAPLLPRLPP